MYLDDLISDVEGIPAFDYYVKKDVNRQSGNVKRRII